MDEIYGLVTREIVRDGERTNAGSSCGYMPQPYGRERSEGSRFDPTSGLSVFQRRDASGLSIRVERSGVLVADGSITREAMIDGEELLLSAEGVDGSRLLLVARGVDECPE